MNTIPNQKDIKPNPDIPFMAAGDPEHEPETVYTIPKERIKVIDGKQWILVEDVIKGQRAIDDKIKERNNHN